MADDLKESGKTITWKVWVFMFGAMAEDMKECIRMIRNMDMECTHGLTAGATKATGLKENNMELALTSYQKRIN